MLFHDFPDMHDLVLGNTDKGGTLNGWFLDKGLILPYGINPFNKNNQYYWGCVLVFTILLTIHIHPSTGVFSGALMTKAEPGLTLR